MIMAEEYNEEFKNLHVFSDTLMIGVDGGDDNAVPVLTVTRLNGVKLDVINVFTGEEAVTLYYALVCGMGNGGEDEATEEADS